MPPSLDYWQDLQTTLVNMQQELQKMHVQNAKSEQERRRDSQMFYDILASRDQELRVINGHTATYMQLLACTTITPSGPAWTRPVRVSDVRLSIS